MPTPPPRPPKVLRRPRPTDRPAPSLDDVDRAIVAALQADGRMPNSELARRAGVAESTCSARLRALRERGVIRGIHADVDLTALGRPIQAMVALRFAGHVRANLEAFRAAVVEVPGVLAAYHVSGATDYLVHVSAESADALRDLVLDELTSRGGVVHAETSLIFDSVRAARG